MAASINLTSSFASGTQIPGNSRDSVFCTGANDSPYLQWTLTDLDPVIQVESFRLICIDTDAAGSGPGGKFIHWKVEDIPPTIFSIGANQTWPVPVTIFPTDYPSGDNGNGWHGPCPPALHNYQIYIEAIIVPQQIEKVGVGVVRSNLFLFTDDPAITIPHGQPSLDDCEGCPPGFTINAETGLCEQRIVVPADCSENLIPVCKGYSIPGNYGSQPAYFFDSVDLSNPANLPLTKTSGSYVLKYQDTTVLAQTGSIANPDPRHTTIWSSRLNQVGVWGPKTGSSTYPNCLPPELWASELVYPAPTTTMQPIQEWIGFTFCVEIPETRPYAIFAAGDNSVRWSVDGQLVLNLNGSSSGVETHRASWIIEVTLTAGTHIFTLEGLNASSVGSFGCEIYAASASDVFDYTSLAELEAVTIFSSIDLVGNEVFDIGEDSGCNCPEGYVLSNCDGELECVQINQTPVSSCCYRIESCDNPGTFYLIELDENIDQLPLEVGTVYKFSGDPLVTGQGCFQLIELTSCNGTELINIVVEETVGDTCDACIPCYELTDCSNPEITLIIQWDPNSQPLVENTSYVFDFAPDTCWTAELQFSPCEGTLYSPTNIVTTYEDCDECLKPCYKLIDCEETYPTISTENTVFEVYIGKVIQWQDQFGENHCATVQKYTCKDETWPAEPIVVLDCFDTCEDCLPKPVPEPIFELSSRSVRPGYNTPGCPPEYYEKVKCKFSEAVYQEMVSKRFGIETCCDIDERKYDIKHELLKLDALRDPYLCNPICATYTFDPFMLGTGDSASTRYIDCSGVEQTLVEPAGLAREYSVEICALTTFTPVITITRANSSIKEYKLKTSYKVCCCTVTITPGNQECTGATYSQDLTITYDQNLTTGNMTVNGQVFPVTGSPQLVTLTELVADGESVDVTVIFSENGSCNTVQQDVFTALIDCLVYHQYRIQVAAGNFSGQIITYRDVDDNIQQLLLFNSKIPYQFQICAQHASVLFNGFSEMYIQGDIPECSGCFSVPGIEVFYEGDCL